MPTFTEIVGAVGGLSGIGALIVSLRRLQIDGRKGTLDELTTVIETYKTELTRCQAEAEKDRTAAIQQVATLNAQHTATVQRLADEHAAQIAELQRQVDQQSRTIQRQSNEITQLKAQMGAA